MLLRRSFAALAIALAAGSSAASTGCVSEATSTADPSASPGSGGDDDGADPGGGPGGGDGDGGSSKPAPKPSEPGCAQDAYTETLPTATSLSDLSFSSATAGDYLVEALGRRYPAGKAIVESALTSKLAQSFGSCIDRFLGDKTTAQKVLRQATTVVHECGHIYDLSEASGSKSTFVILPGETTFTCDGGDTIARGGKTFARSLIRGDAEYAKRAACANGKISAGCDGYANIYLDGDPSDSTFQGGDQGYNTVLEEAAQYVNSLATALAFEDAYQSTNASERDGILTFLWYIERYLALAKSEHPDAYAFITGDACWRQATLTIWDRAWFYLNATKGMTKLGLDDAPLEDLVNNPLLVAEIDALRALECK